MPKTFAPGERHKKNYDERDIEQAVKAIKKGLSKKQASKNKCLGKNPSNKIKQENTVINGALTYEKFFQIVGPNKINEFKKIDNIKENQNEDFMKLYQIWKNFDEGGKQKHKNEDRESISEEILNIQTMELFINDVHLEYIDESTETNENASLENKSLNLSNICDNNIMLDQTTKIVDINDQIPSYAGNEVTLEKKRQNSKQFNEKVKILSDIQILPSSRTHVRNLLTVLDGETDKHCQSTLEEQASNPFQNADIYRGLCYSW
ncbi:hypothetical protein ILUMI_18319, partial [Ignelater luminosus]